LSRLALLAVLEPATNWEVAGFAAGILFTAAAGVLPMKKRIDDLEKRVSALVGRNGR
jgi:hypothetical protein